MQGRPRHLRLEEFELRPGRTGPPGVKGRVPGGMASTCASLSLDVKLTTRLNNQELAGKSKPAAVYWEGASRYRALIPGAAIWK